MLRKINPDIANLFYKIAVDEASTALSKTNMKSIDVGGSGYAPYYYQTVDNHFYRRTWEYINHSVQDSGNGRVALGDIPLSNRYHDYVSKLGYALSSFDQDKINTAKEKMQDASRKLVADYEAIYGRITDKQLSDAQHATKLDYIASYMLDKWAGAAGFKLTEESASNPQKYLPNLPPSAQTLLPGISECLSGLMPVAGLWNAVLDAQNLRSTLLSNILHPGDANGGVQVQDDTKNISWNVGFTVNEAVSTIMNSINSDAGFTIDMTFSDFSEKKASLNIAGKAGGVISAAEVINFVLDSGVSYSLDQLNTSFSQCKVHVIYKGVTAVTFHPTLYQVDSRTGWYDMDPINDAVENGHKTDVSGWRFNPYPQDDGIGLLEYLAISQYPTISIEYTTGSATETTEKMRSAASLGVELFGIKLGSVGYNYSCSEFTGGAGQQGFTIKFSAPYSPTGNNLDRRAYVIGCGVKRTVPPKQ